MVYIQSWDSFVEAAQQLFLASPEKVQTLSPHKHPFGRPLPNEQANILGMRTDLAAAMGRRDTW
jgi:hypothetical protein